MDRRRFLGTVGSGVLVSLGGCIGGEAATVDHDIGMTMHTFRPDTLSVGPGTTVVFRNTSSHAHTVTAFQNGYPDDAEYWASGGFSSEAEATEAWQDGSNGALYSGDTFEHTFEIPGQYSYFCIPHLDADMVGVITVEEP